MGELTIVDLGNYSVEFSTLFNYLGLTLGVLGILLAIFLYYKSRLLRMPLYTVNNNRIVVEETEALSEGITPKATYYTEIALWNGGKDYIEKDDILRSIAIKADNAKIIHARIDKKSRDDLPLSLNIKDGEIEFNIEGDEVLESMDGALIHILYEGSDKCKWLVDSRIKGVPLGFQPIDWSIIKNQNKGVILILEILYIACILAMGGICAYSLYHNLVKIKLYACIWVVAAIWYLYYSCKVYYYRMYWPRWLNMTGSLIG